MKGAVQGEATTTASTPAAKLPAGPEALARAAAPPASALPSVNSNTPKRLSAMARKSRPSSAIAQGDCS